jgi:hypothetical protein
MSALDPRFESPEGQSNHGVKTLTVMTGHGPHSQHGYDALMITVLTRSDVDLTEAEANALSDFLRAYHSLQLVSLGKPPLQSE